MSNAGKVVKQFTSKKGNLIVIRYLRWEDLDEITRYINELSKEDTFITFSGETITKEGEADYVGSTLKAMEFGDKVKLCCFINDKLIGLSDITRDTHSRSRSRHIAILGISIAQDYRREGIGEILMRTAIEEAKQTIKNLKIITLIVYGINDKAVSLYKKIGFNEYGRLPKGIQYRGEFVDHVEMYLEV